jgi:hypothetical protein
MEKDRWVPVVVIFAGFVTVALIAAALFIH